MATTPVRIPLGPGRRIRIPHHHGKSHEESSLIKQDGGEEVRIKFSFDPTPHMALRGYVTNEEHMEMVNNISYLFSGIVEDIQWKMYRFLCFAACYMTCGGGLQDYVDRVNALQSEVIPKLNDEYGFTARGIQYRLVSSQGSHGSAHIDVELASDAKRL